MKFVWFVDLTQPVEAHLTIRSFRPRVAQGLAALGLSDQERLRIGFSVYDALYAYVGGK